jgi:hypothetical protein
VICLEVTNEMHTYSVVGKWEENNEIDIDIAP